MPIRQPRVFTIPSGAPFLPTLSRALLDGVLVEDFPGAGGPTALADATIYVPTQRAAAALGRGAACGERRAEPHPAAHRAARRLRADEPARASPPRATRLRAPRCRRRSASSPAAMCSRPSIRAWGAGAARRDPRRSTPTGGSSSTPPSRRWSRRRRRRPTRSPAILRALIDDMIIEGVAWTKLETLAPDAYDPYWRITLDFLKIAFAHWPLWLDEHGLIDRRQAGRAPDRRRNQRARRRAPAAVRRSSPARPAPIARPRALIAAIARAPAGRGRAARPRPRSRRRRLGDDRRERRDSARARRPSAGAPAPADRRRSASTRDDVATLGALSPALAARSAFLTEALRPAEFDRSLARAGGRAVAAGASPPRSRASRSSSPTMKPKRRWRWPSRCAKRSRRRARPRP